MMTVFEVAALRIEGRKKIKLNMLDWSSYVGLVEDAAKYNIGEISAKTGLQKCLRRRILFYRWKGKYKRN